MWFPFVAINENVWNHRPGKTGCLGFHKDISKSIVKIIPINTICKYPFAFYTSGNNMMKRTRGLPATASSGEAGGHLFLIGVTCKSEIIVQTPCQLIN
jgi:hypothetical protein